MLTVILDEVVQGVHQGKRRLARPKQLSAGLLEFFKLIHVFVNEVSGLFIVS